MENIISGVLEILEHKAFLRDPFNNFEIEENDIEIPKELIKRFKIREGCFVVAETEEGKLKNILAVNNLAPDKYRFTKLHGA